ncbi:SIS domain-containing protein [Phytoactinopolyspora endophytica]|uniref:SIS domain-containing protein n=1 Tax=Phytoactinopolyspora endophytica TaxID=1642495 RepID=UPI00101C781A|nr:SIS domain-containing protein [Phytoactinopolyspora endophytica]
MFADASLDDPQALSAIDDALREIAGWGAQVRRAHTAAAGVLAQLDPMDRPRAIVASGPHGRLFRAVLEPICPMPFVAWPHGGLPAWAGPLDLVIIVCPDGGREEEVAAAAEARRRGCSLLVAAPEESELHTAAAGRETMFLPAGSTDTTALAVPVLCALHLLGLGPEVEAEPVAEALDQVAKDCAPTVEADVNPGKNLALALADSTPLVWGGSVLAARAARRVAESLREASGRPAVAGDDTQLVPLLSAAPEADLFADPFEDGSPELRPALLILDDGTEPPMAAAARRRLEEAAEQAAVRVYPVLAVEGSQIVRFATLLAIGRYAAAYLALGLGRRH